MEKRRRIIYSRATTVLGNRSGCSLIEWFNRESAELCKVARTPQVEKQCQKLERSCCLNLSIRSTRIDLPQSVEHLKLRCDHDLDKSDKFCHQILIEWWFTFWCVLHDGFKFIHEKKNNWNSQLLSRASEVSIWKSPQIKRISSDESNCFRP